MYGGIASQSEHCRGFLAVGFSSPRARCPGILLIIIIELATVRSPASLLKLLLFTHRKEMERSTVPNAAAAKSLLEAQLAELEGRRDRIAEDLAEPLNPDSSEQAVEMEDDISLEGQAALIAREITSVKRALTRIENGTYGECVRCGAKISPKRLEARPEAALCFGCASKEQ
jgi:RNA polymerase-binding transcription factor DksA